MTSLLRPTAPRAVHLTINPRPSTLSESREILRLLTDNFGAVEHFRSLKYARDPRPHYARVVFRDEASVKNALWASPLRFRMGRSRAASSPQGGDGTGRNGTALSSDARVEGDGTEGFSGVKQQPQEQRPQRKDQPRQRQDESRLFQIKILPATRVQIQERVDSGKYHGGFAINTETESQPDLAKRVPLKGLSCIDWRAPEKPWRLSRNERRDDWLNGHRPKDLWDRARLRRGAAGGD